MKPRHAAALALVGWYLMMPPTQSMLDSSCPPHIGILDSLIATVTMESHNDHLTRCNREATTVVPNTPFSRWLQNGEFETLAECRADQKTPLTREEIERAEVAAAFSFGVSKEDLLRTLKPGAFPIEVPRQLRSTPQGKIAFSCALTCTNHKCSIRQRLERGGRDSIVRVQVFGTVQCAPVSG
jgi:hypothetical protein